MNFFGPDPNSAAGPFDICPEMGQNLEHEMNITQIRHVINDAFFAGEQRGCEDRKSRIFRAANFYGAAQLMTAMYKNLIHKLQKEIVLLPDNQVCTQFV